ncbi:hypothetical protein VP14_073 [Vibrio phage VPMCC14]|nr:hypothetical protein VP14_073 [Vibrio phage VPMCC14]
MIEDDKTFEWLYEQSNVELNSKQKKFLELFINSKNNAVLQGLAGAGKSTLLKLLKKWYGDEIAIFCSTGVASQNLPVSYGTAHSYLSMPIKPATELDYKKISPKCSGLMASSDKVKIICIDEAFLLNSDNLDVIHRRIERFNRKYKKRSRRNIRLLLVGDSGQSVTIADKVLQQELRSRWSHHLMFKSTVWDRFNFDYYVLDKVERQEDKVYKACLDVIRYNQQLRFNKCFEWLNKRCDGEYDPEWIYLSATNKVVDKINTSVINKNPNPKIDYKPIIKDDFNIKDTLVREGGTTLCKDLKVMAITNDEFGRWSNGSVGTVTAIDTQGCYVRFNHSGSEDYVELHKWENKEVYSEEVTDKETGEVHSELKERVVGSMVCIPLIPASSISISKSQGLTISEDYIIDLGEEYLYTWEKMEDFGTNFLYLALSRGVDINKVHLKKPVNSKFVKVSNESIEFWEYCKGRSLI